MTIFGHCHDVLNNKLSYACTCVCIVSENQALKPGCFALFFFAKYGKEMYLSACRTCSTIPELKQRRRGSCESVI